MKFHYILFFLLFPIFLLAQTSYQSSDFAGISESILVTTAPYSLTPGQSISTGLNHTWDFQDLPAANQSMMEYTDPNTAGYKLSWCFINGFIFNCDQAFNDHVNRASRLFDFNLNGFVLEDAYTHYNLIGTTLEEKFIGATVGFGETPIPATIDLEDIDTIYQFPIMYANVDSARRRFVADLGSFGIDIRYSSTSKRKNEVDGWGILITPFATFDQTLRMRTTIAGTDTITLDTTMVTFDYQNVEYKWFDPAYPIPVLVINSTITEAGEVFNQVTYIDSARCIQPDARFAFLPLAPELDSLTESTTINFTNLSTGFSEVFWDFGDGLSSNLLNPSHTYVCGGERTVMLIATNTICNPVQTDTFTMSITPDESGALAAQNMVREENHVLYANLEGVDYQWLNCENGTSPIPGATEITYELPTTGGSFALAITTPNGCIDTSECIFYDAFVGMDPVRESPFRLYPNPVLDICIIENTSVEEIESISIYTLEGKNVRHIQVGKRSSISFSIDLDPGMYILQIQTNNYTYGHLVIKAGAP